MEHLHLSLLTQIILFSLLGGVLSVIAASTFLLLPESWRNRSLPHLVSFAIGALLGAAFLALLPHAINFAEGDVHDITFTVLLGLMGFFLLEKMVLWRHCHSDSCEAHAPDVAAESHGHHHHDDGKGSTGAMILIGDGLHNFIGGLAIAGTFVIDIRLGIMAWLAALIQNNRFTGARGCAAHTICLLAIGVWATTHAQKNFIARCTSTLRTFRKILTTEENTFTGTATDIGSGNFNLGDV